jgi:hypothetical protein
VGAVNSFDWIGVRLIDAPLAATQFSCVTIVDARGQDRSLSLPKFHQLSGFLALTAMNWKEFSALCAFFPETWMNQIATWISTRVGPLMTNLNLRKTPPTGGQVLLLTPVPEPSSLALCLAGAAGVVCRVCSGRVCAGLARSGTSTPSIRG